MFIEVNLARLIELGVVRIVEAPVPPAAAAPKPKSKQAQRKSNWVDAFVDVWERRFGVGSASYPIIGSQLKPLIDGETFDKVLAAWKRYLDPAVNQSPAQFITPAAFRQKWAQWLPNAKQSSAPARQDLTDLVDMFEGNGE